MITFIKNNIMDIGFYGFNILMLIGFVLIIKDIWKDWK